MTDALVIRPIGPALAEKSGFVVYRKQLQEAR